jgi:hypothetical protein
MPDVAQVDAAAFEVAILYAEGFSRVEASTLEAAILYAEGFSRVEASTLEAAIIDLISPQAIASNIGGPPGVMATFDGSSSIADGFKWTWTSRPPGSIVGDKEALPDNEDTFPVDMTDNRLLLHFEEVSGATPVPYPDNGVNTPIDMTGNVGLWHYDSTSIATATPFPDNGVNNLIDMTNNEGLYHFEGSANDSSGGNALNGQINGATQSAGAVGSNAYSFDGNNDYIDFGANFQFTTGDFTWSFWMNPDASQNGWQQFIGTFGGTTGDGFFFEQYSSSSGQYRIQCGNGSSWSANNTTMVIPTGQWSHIVIVRVGNVITGHLNGAAVYTDVAPTTIANHGNFIVGASANLSNFWEGAVDELAIWSRALSSAEILNIFDLQSSGLYAPGTSPNTAKGWLYNSPSLVAGKVGAQALDFDGVNQYMHADLGPTAPTTDGSISCWFKSGSNNSRPIVGFMDNRATKNGSWRTISLDGQLKFWGYANDINNIIPVATGVWHHAVITWANTDDVVVYFNGVKVAAQTFANLVTPATQLWVAGRPDNSDNTDVEVDEVAIWNRAITESEVANIYSKQSAGSIKDSSGNGAHLIDYSSTLVAGVLGSNSADLNGTDQYIEGVIPNGPTTEGTIAGWLRLNTSPADYDRLFGLGGVPNGSYQGNSRALLIRNTRRLFFGGYWHDEADVSDPLTVGQWYHIALTWMNTNEMEVLIDGESYKTWIEPGLILPINNFWIGRRPDGGATF